MSPRYDIHQSAFAGLVKPQNPASSVDSRSISIRQTSIPCDKKQLHSCSIGNVVLVPLHRFHVTAGFENTVRGLLQFVKQSQIQTIVIADTAPSDIANNLVREMTKSNASVFYIDHHAEPDTTGQDTRYEDIQKILGRNCIVSTRDESPSTAALLGFGTLSPHTPTLYLCYPPDFDAIVSGLYACGIDPVQLNQQGESLHTLDVLARIDSPKSAKVKEMSRAVRDEELPTWALGLLSISRLLSHDIHCVQIMTALAGAANGGPNAKQAKRTLRSFEANERKRLQAAQLLFKKCVEVYSTRRVFKITIEGKQLNADGYSKIESYNPALVSHARQLLSPNTAFDSETLHALLWKGMTPIDYREILSDGCIIAEQMHGKMYLITARGRIAGVINKLVLQAGSDIRCPPTRRGLGGFSMPAESIDAFLSALDTRLKALQLDMEVSRSRGWDPNSHTKR